MGFFSSLFDGLSAGFTGVSLKEYQENKNCIHQARANTTDVYPDIDSDSYDMSNEEILEMVNDEDEEILSSKYRKTALQNSNSNYGWYTCPKCGRKFRASDMDADHIMPKSCGGTNSRYNLQMLCYHCNRSKQNDTSDTFADLARRKQELDKQDKEDLEFMKHVDDYLKIQTEQENQKGKKRRK